MKKTLVLLTMFALCAGPARAEETKIDVIVKGMVCSFCAQGIQKKLSKLPEVATVKVDLAEKRVSLTLKPGRDIAAPLLRKAINDAGYDVVEVRRGEKKE